MNTVQKLMLVVLFLFVHAYAGAASASLGYMRISLIEGELHIKTPEAGQWGYGAVNAPLDVGDELWVPQGGRAELQLDTGTYIRIDGNTALQILSMDNDASQFYLSQGNAYVYYNAQQGGVIQVDTQHASTRAFARSIFSLGAMAQYTDVAVYKGYVITENRVGETRVNAGNRVFLGQDTNGEITSLGYLNEWEQWNQARDERLYEVRESPSARYLAPELRSYYADLDYNGRWVHVHDYGYVWTPRTYIRSGWTPYREGRWFWRGGHYIWLPYEPWGWVPYHYGRWAFVGGVGWCWVPPPPGHVYWGPGYVGWIRTVDYVAWVPLAPGEIYYGYGSYGRDSVNIINVNIDDVRFTNMYRNVAVENGPIIVKQHAFRQGSHEVALVDNDIRDKVFTRQNMIPGPPDVKPGKKHLFLKEQGIPKEKRAPQEIRLQPVTEMKQLRRLMREPDESVFSPGAAPVSLPVKTADPERIQREGKPKLEKIPPVQRERLERPLPGGPTGIRGGGKEVVQPPPGQQARPMGPPADEAGPRKRVGQPPPVQRENLDRPLPGGPASVRDGEKEMGQPLPDQKTRPIAPPADMPGPRKRVDQPPPVQRENLDRPLPAGPPVSREREKALGQPQPEPSGRHQRPAGEPVGSMRRVEPPHPVQPIPPDQHRPRGDEGRRDIGREGKRVQPVPQPVPVPLPQEKPRKGNMEPQPQAEAPQCGPGQDDQADPAKCPQNFQPHRKSGGFAR